MRGAYDYLDGVGLETRATLIRHSDSISIDPVLEPQYAYCRTARLGVSRLCLTSVGQT